EDPEPREPRVDVHERRERTREPAPHAAREPEVRSDADDPGEEDVDEVVVVEADSENGPVREEPVVELLRGVADRRTGPAPRDHAAEEEQERGAEDDLPRHVHAVP